MFTKLKQKFQDNPKFYYAMSIAASWAGAGSLMNSTTLANTLGVIPSLIWCVCNTLACIVFGLVIWYLPTVRRVMKTKVCRAVLAIFSIFQIWLCMTAINEAWAATSFGPIVVRPDYTIIDGFHRWTVAGREPLHTKLGGKVPVVIVHHDQETDDIYGTITHNRARGTHLLEPMKAIVKRLIDEGKTVQEISKQLGMRAEEVFRLTDFTREDFLNMMTQGTQEYSKAQIIRKV